MFLLCCANVECVNVYLHRAILFIVLLLGLSGYEGMKYRRNLCSFCVLSGCIEELPGLEFADQAGSRFLPQINPVFNR